MGAIAEKVEMSLTRASLIRKMFEEGSRLRQIYGADKVYDFTLGKPVHELPARFYQELRRLAENPIPGMHRYMSNASYPESRQAVAEVVAEDSSLALLAARRKRFFIHSPTSRSRGAVRNREP